MSKVTDELLDHDYDGIREYDNPLPAWWRYLLYGSIAWAFVYYPFYQFGSGKLPTEAYEEDMAEWLKLHPPVQLAGAEEMSAMLANGELRSQGEAIFKIRCAACHAPDGGGLVGPNLTDDFSIHGGAAHEMVRVVYDGVPAKGMLAWKTQLSLDEIYAVTVYAHSLRGTTPAKPKAPEGEAIVEEPDAAVDPAVEEPDAAVDAAVDAAADAATTADAGDGEAEGAQDALGESPEPADGSDEAAVAEAAEAADNVPAAEAQ